MGVFILHLIRTTFEGGSQTGLFPFFSLKMSDLSSPATHESPQVRRLTIIVFLSVLVLLRFLPASKQRRTTTNFEFRKDYQPGLALHGHYMNPEFQRKFSSSADLVLRSSAFPRYRFHASIHAFYACFCFIEDSYRPLPIVMLKFTFKTRKPRQVDDEARSRPLSVRFDVFKTSVKSIFTQRKQIEHVRVSRS